MKLQKLSLISIILIIVFIGFNCGLKHKRVTANSKSLGTFKYAGTYRSGSLIDTSKTSEGEVIIYALTNDSVLFHLNVNRGTPSYNSGVMYARLYVSSNKAVLNKQFLYCDSLCKLEFEFSDSTLTIKTIKSDCGLGGGVLADGIYRKVNSQQPKYFEDGEGKKVYFNTTTPEKYYK